MAQKVQQASVPVDVAAMHGVEQGVVAVLADAVDVGTASDQFADLQRVAVAERAYELEQLL
jgi:hypothetical protein